VEEASAFTVAQEDLEADLMADSEVMVVLEEDLMEGSGAMEVLVAMEVSVFMEEGPTADLDKEEDLMEVLVATEDLVLDPKHQPADTGAKHPRAKTSVVRRTSNPPRTL